MNTTDQAMELLRAQLGAQVVSDTGPVLEHRALAHNLRAVLIPRGLTRAQENRLRAALGVPPRPVTRKAS